MIPTFPKFKNLAITDRDKINRFLPRKPFSDYNFTNLWCWDTSQKRMVSQLNGNLVVIFTDYVSNKLFLSFCGKNKPVSTARTLLKYAKENGIEPILKYIPNSTAQCIKSERIQLLPDSENFDYIFSTTQISKANGSRFKKKRQLANKFIREHPTSFFKIDDLSEASVQRQVMLTMARWRRKKKNVSEADFKHEKAALIRLLKSAHNHSVVLSAIYKGSTMLAFSIDEILPNKYAISHFLKADNGYTGVYEYLNQQTAKYLKKRGVEYWNWEQDLNIEGLRNLKMSYRPIRFLKKFRVSLIH